MIRCEKIAVSNLFGCLYVRQTAAMEHPETNHHPAKDLKSQILDTCVRFQNLAAMEHMKFTCNLKTFNSTF